MWDEIIFKVAITVASSVASYLVASYKAKYEAALKKEQERDEIIRKLVEAMQLSMRRDLKEDGKRYLNNNSLTAEEALDYEEYYLCYERLGKNGRIDNIVKRVRSLPITDRHGDSNA